MSEDEIVALGNFCENLRNSPSWKILLDQFEKQIVEHMLHTEPHEAKKREGIYASFLGVRDFLGHLKAIETDRDQIIERNKAPSNEDAPIEED
jgi:hypothetical protein